MKKIATIALMAIAFPSLAQKVGMGISAGYSSKQSAVIDLSAKRRYDSFSTALSVQIHSNAGNPKVPVIWELREGFKYRFLEPYIGIGYHMAGQDNKPEYRQYRGIKPAYGITAHYNRFTFTTGMSGKVFTAKVGVELFYHPEQRKVIAPEKVVAVNTTFDQYRRYDSIYNNLEDTVNQYKGSDVVKTTDALIDQIILMDSMRKYINAVNLNLSQNKPEKKWYSITGRDGIIMGLQVVSGAADGLNQVLDHHWHTFERKFPNADPNFWNPKLSMNNKNNTWVVISDGFHLSRGIEHTFNYASIAISFGDLMQYPKKDRWKVIAKNFLLSYAANRIGFVGIYNGYFNDRVEREKAGLDGN